MYRFTSSMLLALLLVSCAGDNMPQAVQDGLAGADLKDGRDGDGGTGSEVQDGSGRKDGVSDLKSDVRADEVRDGRLDGGFGDDQSGRDWQWNPDAGNDGIPNVGLTWIPVPAGTFLMGCSLNDSACDSDELPAHEVTMPPFSILETEVTEAQYQAVTGINPSCHFAGAAGPDLPVECVGWANAMEFCVAIGGRLPTEAEWEYAARGQTATAYYCGENASCLDGIAWYALNSGDMKHPVKTTTPNAYGLYDMLGNLWEWTGDWYGDYSAADQTNPQGPESGAERVKRGGSFNYESLRVSNRYAGDPKRAQNDLGFRCVNSRCGNGACDGTETPCNCPADCGVCAGCCSAGVCEDGMTSQACGKAASRCAVCSGGLTCQNQTCVYKCGDGVCGGTETQCNCPADCGACAGCCKNDLCMAGTANTDCGSGSAACAACSSGQSCQNQTCVYMCGDGICGGMETPCNCPGDCGSCAGCCKDGGCESGTTSAKCGKGAADCVSCTGDSVCAAGSCADIGLKWMPVPAGAFQMGCSPNDTMCDEDEKPAHPVILSAFSMLESEVTEGQYQAVMGNNPSCHFNNAAGADLPVECVNWEKARKFCEAAGGRLPTEAEWEYAARGKKTTKYYCGDRSACLDGIAWYAVNSGARKHPVKGKTPNLYGLYDMLGNVWEWTNDYYGDYSAEIQTNPQGPAISGDKVRRGGSFNYESLRVSNRYGGDPVHIYQDLGFRCARSK